MTNSGVYSLPGIPTHKDPIEAIKQILVEYNTSLQEISQKTRKQDVLIYRQIIQALLSRNTHMTLEKIGFAIGRKDHATVLNSRARIEEAEFIHRKTGKKTDTFKLYTEIETKYKQLTRSWN